MKYILFLVFLCLFNHAFAENVFVEEFQAVGVNPDTAKVVSELIKDSIQEKNKFKIVTDKKNAEIILTGKIMGLDNEFILTATSMKPNGDVIRSERLKSNSKSEFDVITRRLADAVLENKTTTEVMKYNEITQAERSKSKTRYESTVLVRTRSYI